MIKTTKLMNIEESDLMHDAHVLKQTKDMKFLQDRSKGKHIEDIHKTRLLNLLSNSVLKKDGID